MELFGGVAAFTFFVDHDSVSNIVPFRSSSCGSASSSVSVVLLYGKNTEGFQLN